MFDCKRISHLLYDEESELLLCVYWSKREKYLIDSYSQHVGSTEWVKRDTYEHNYYIRSVFIHGKQMYALLLGNSGRDRFIHQLDKRNQFKVGQQLDTSNIPPDKRWMLTVNRSYFVVVSCSCDLYDFGKVKSVHLFKNNQQVKHLKMAVQHGGFRPIATECRTHFV